MPEFDPVMIAVLPFRVICASVNAASANISEGRPESEGKCAPAAWPRPALRPKKNASAKLALSY
jgi:hypothetical protein